MASKFQTLSGTKRLGLVLNVRLGVAVAVAVGVGAAPRLCLDFELIGNMCVDVLVTQRA